jgi:hypothetical protein
MGFPSQTAVGMRVIPRVIRLGVREGYYYACCTVSGCVPQGAGSVSDVSVPLGTGNEVY